MSTRTIRVWDLPTRIFHWLLFLAVTGAIITGELGGKFFVWHGRIGVIVLGLLLFRLIWGLAGSTYARFASFIPNRASIRAYLAGDWHGAGHNPLGALSVLAMLGFLLLQVTTGLFASNHRAQFHGPLYDLVGKSLSHAISDVHEFLFNITLALLILHVAAIVYYLRVKRKNLVRPMLTGEAEIDEESLQHARGGSLTALILGLILAVGLVWLLGG